MSWLDALPVVLSAIIAVVEIWRSAKVRKILTETFTHPRLTSILRRDERSGEFRVTLIGDDSGTAAHARG
jgi:hypothetical protein